MKTEIGVAEITFREDGTPQAATFVPANYNVPSAQIEKEFLGCGKAPNEETIRAHAMTALSSWFASVEAVELADKDKIVIESELIQPCLRWPNGNIFTCKIRFFATEKKVEKS